MLFIAIMVLTTTCVAGAAAFFSVYGLAHTFQAAFWSVVFMGGSLEAGKLMITSYLYRFRDTMTWGRKALGIFFVFGLMLVTSLGIYGYLADAYQAGSTDKKQIDASVVLKREEQTNLQKRKAEIDMQIASVPAKDTRGKQRLITQFGPEVNTINKRLIDLTAEIQQAAQTQITTDSHVGPIVFIAKIVGLDPDAAMSYFILVIIFLFDPVAIYLTVATNEAIAKYKRKEKPLEYGPSEEGDKLFSQLRENYSLDKVHEAFDDLPRREVIQEPYNPIGPKGYRGDEPGPMDFPEVVEKMEEIKEALAEAISQPLVNDEQVEHIESFTPVQPVDEIVLPLPEGWVTEDYITPHHTEGRGSHVETLPSAEEWTLEPMVVSEPPVVEVPEVPLEQTFEAHTGDDVEPEVQTEKAAEEDPIEEIKDIYQDLTSQQTQTPGDLEAVKMIERFFARQQLVKDVRTGNISQ